MVEITRVSHRPELWSERVVGPGRGLLEGLECEILCALVSLGSSVAAAFDIDPTELGAARPPDRIPTVLCSVCGYPMTFAHDILAGRHASCEAS